MLEKDNPEILLKTQADLLGISYASLFYEPVPSSARELTIKRDEIHAFLKVLILFIGRIILQISL